MSTVKFSVESMASPPGDGLPNRQPLWRRIVCALTSVCLILTHTAVQAGPPEEGIAAGQAANPVARGSITTPQASNTVPGYTSTPAETGYYQQPNLTSQGQSRLALCATQPNDPVCQAQRGAVTSANTPRPSVLPTDPAVDAARQIGNSPSGVLGSLASYYSGCTTNTTATPAGMQNRRCLRYDASGNYSCSRQLTVGIERQVNCNPGDWFAHVGDARFSLDVQCVPNRPASSQHMRVTRDGQVLRVFDMNMSPPTVFPEWVELVNLQTSWQTQFVTRTGLWVANKSCNAGTCSLNAMIADELRESCTGSGDSGYSCTYAVPFLKVYGPCRSGTQSGDHLVLASSPATCTKDENGQCITSFLAEDSCYAPSTKTTPGAVAASDNTGSTPAAYWIYDSSRDVIGWKVNPEYGPPSSIPVMPLSYPQPATTVTETDRWDDTCPNFSGGGAGGSSAGGRCTPSASVCTEGPGTRVINGAPVTRSCWAYTQNITCANAAPLDQCAPLAASGCTFVSSVCKQPNPTTGQCAVFEDVYSCPTPAQSSTSVGNCPNNVFCLAGNCYSIASPNDPDFARSMTMLEAAREAGVYIETDSMEVFRGEHNRCRIRLLKNCCNTNSAGAGMSNQSMYTVGSRLVFDTLMNSGNREFLYQGMSALLTSGGFSGSFTTYGVTVAVNGTALPAGSAVLYAGESVVVAFDPWSLVIAIVIYIILSLTSCNAEEGKLAMKEGAKLCHTVGTRCTSCFMLLGHCVSCVEHTTSKCCFNSVLARLINEQGRAQIGKGWGSAEFPDCSGFTVAQLQSLNFAAMDLTEFYASIVPTLPNVNSLQGQSGGRISNCYFGQGRCQ